MDCFSIPTARRRQLSIQEQPCWPTASFFRLASMTKPVTAVALLMLFEEGLVRLDDPAAAFVPELRDLSVAADGLAASTVPPAREITNTVNVPNSVAL